MANNFTFEDVKNAWNSKSVFVEDFLSRFAKLINLDNSKLLTGYEYLSEENLIGSIKLNFSSINKKTPAELGLTEFFMVSGSGLVDAKSGEKQISDWIITNEGDTSKGLEIIITGYCIENGLIIPDFAELNLLFPIDDKQNKFSASFIETTSTTGEKLFYARVEDIVIPKGYKPSFPMTPKESKRYGRVRYEYSIRFSISFFVCNEDVGEFTVFFCPLVNREEGYYSSTVFKGQLDDYLKKKTL